MMSDKHKFMVILYFNVSLLQCNKTYNKYVLTIEFSLGLVACNYV